ncbi:DUF998 domain-containing protein [Acidilobus saccharovorans]|uniref:DUF998 domain-containing protein n=1 Tax=Acidilobus saccharovorans TaxID=242703 RepID=UPI0009FC527F|nr:DUF998 domain-containing protein [Acidilobus saccharovorans]
MRALRYLGITAAAVAWVIIIACVSINPWFVFTKNAFSDLGGPRATDPWLYNYGLIAVGALIIAFASYAVSVSSEKLEAVGASFMMVAGLFLALIGVFHEGTYPHVFVSQWFFAQMDMTSIVWGAGSIVSGRAKRGAAEVAIGVIGPAGAIAFRWPSAATLEAYGIVLIDLFVILMTFDLRDLEG